MYYVVLTIDFYIPGKRVYCLKDDLKTRQKVTPNVTKTLTDKFWEAGISFYIDAAGFQHKYNPHDEARFLQTMVW